MNSARDLHIPLIVFWEMTRGASFLSEIELTHLEDCERCIRTLGICEMAKSIDHAEQLLNEES
jgi:hypothetical protein